MKRYVDLAIRVKRLQVVTLFLTLFVGLVWWPVGYADSLSSATSSDISHLSYKDKIQLDIKSEAKQQVADRLQTVIADCKAKENQAACKKQYPFRILQRENSINNLATCLANQTLLCISEELNSVPTVCSASNSK